MLETLFPPLQNILRKDLDTNMLLSLVEFQKVLARCLDLGIPSMAVFNGHAIAGGAFLGMVHDRIIMNSDKKFIIQLNELTFGKAPPYSYTRPLPFHFLSLLFHFNA